MGEVLNGEKRVGRERKGVKESRPFGVSSFQPYRAVGLGPSPSAVTPRAKNPLPEGAGGGECTSRPAPSPEAPLPSPGEHRPLGTSCAAPIDGRGPRWCVISLLQEQA